MTSAPRFVPTPPGATDLVPHGSERWGIQPAQPPGPAQPSWDRPVSVQLGATASPTPAAPATATDAPALAPTGATGVPPRSDPSPVPGGAKGGQEEPMEMGQQTVALGDGGRVTGVTTIHGANVIVRTPLVGGFEHISILEMANVTAIEEMSRR